MSNDTQVQAHMALVENYLRADTMQHRAAVEASARQLAEQPGFVMVPVAPTSNMLAAMSGEWHSSRHDNARKQYAAALAARPLTASPTAQPSVEPVGEREAFEAWCEAHLMPAESDWFRRETDEPDEYRNPMIDMAWAAWCAARTKGTI